MTYELNEQHPYYFILMVDEVEVGGISLEENGEWSYLLHDEAVEVNDQEIGYADTKDKAAHLLYVEYLKSEGAN